MLLASLNMYLTLPSRSLGKDPASQTGGANFDSSLETTFFCARILLVSNQHLE